MHTIKINVENYGDCRQQEISFTSMDDPEFDGFTLSTFVTPEEADKLVGFARAVRHISSGFRITLKNSPWRNIERVELDLSAMRRNPDIGVVWYKDRKLQGIVERRAS